MSKPKVIAFYLPQYHPTPDNDKWWGKGFTEWTNVGKAKPLFKGHFQPKIPADLGYYDLRLPQVREAQAQLAKEAGIFGFCYWSYWFGNGKEELELPFNEVLNSGKPEFPFMLCWCNESWYKKMWDKDINGDVKELILEQKYPGEEDIINHFYHRLPAFKDKRYIISDNKPVFMIYDYSQYPDVSNFIRIWKELAKKEGFDDMIFIAHVRHDVDEPELKEILSLGFDYVNCTRLYESFGQANTLYRRIKNRILRDVFKVPTRYNYKDIYKFFKNRLIKNPYIFPTIYPNWDPSPRRGVNTVILDNCEPHYFGKHCSDIFASIQGKEGLNLVFLRAWNEWGEGNYMEPDIKYGKRYIEELRNVLENL